MSRNIPNRCDVCGITTGDLISWDKLRVQTARPRPIAAIIRSTFSIFGYDDGDQSPWHRAPLQDLSSDGGRGDRTLFACFPRTCLAGRSWHVKMERPGTWQASVGFWQC